jgi:hypothetical protein
MVIAKTLVLIACGVPITLGLVVLVLGRMRKRRGLLVGGAAVGGIGAIALAVALMAGTHAYVFTGRKPSIAHSTLLVFGEPEGFRQELRPGLEPSFGPWILNRTEGDLRVVSLTYAISGGDDGGGGFGLKAGESIRMPADHTVSYFGPDDAPPESIESSIASSSTVIWVRW